MGLAKSDIGQTGHDLELSLRIDRGDGKRFGPGKARLLELIAEHGSISAAGRAMGMSYRRAWLLVDDLNAFGAVPLVQTWAGGAHGGGAGLTRTGQAVLTAYRRMEGEAGSLAALQQFANLLR